MDPVNRSGKSPIHPSNPALDAVTGLLLGGLIGPLVGAGVSLFAVLLYLLSWLTIIGIPVGYILLMAGFPHGFWAAWAASAAGGLIGGYRSSRAVSTDMPGADISGKLGMAVGIPVALLVMIVRLVGSHDWRQPLQYSLALVLALAAGAVGGVAGAAFVMAMNRRRT